MADDRELVQTLVQALRRIEADADDALQHGGPPQQGGILYDGRDITGKEAALLAPFARSAAYLDAPIGRSQYVSRSRPPSAAVALAMNAPITIERAVRIAMEAAVLRAVSAA
jgi:hypothetical protein